MIESLRDPEVKEREFKALIQAMNELKVEKVVILSQDEKPADPKYPEIEVKAIYHWLLKS